MKKAILVLLVGLLLSGNANAGVIKLDCNPTGYGDFAKYTYSSEFFKVTIDTKLKKLLYHTRSNNETYSTWMQVISMDDQYVTFKSPGVKSTFRLDYKNFIEVTLKPKYEEGYDMRCVHASDSDIPENTDTASSGSSSSSSTDDKIAQAKQICKDLGFKTKTEKFADCSLKMLSMQFEVQNRETSSDGGTQQKIVVNQGYSVGDAMIALSGIISDANNVRSSYGGGNCRIFQHAYHASLRCN